jgi:Aspartyl protease
MKQYLRSVAQPVVFSVYVLLFVTSHVTAQQPIRDESARRPQEATPKVQFTSGNSTVRIPLEIDNNIILMIVSVDNSKPLKFIFDTGASASLISSQRAAELGLKAEGEAHGNATGRKFQGSYTKGISLSVPGAEVPNQLIAWFPFPTIPDFEFDGVIGYDFINQFVVEIDYQNKIMNLYNPRTYTYSGKGAVIPISLAKKTPTASMKIILEGRAPVEVNLGVDTGADGTFVINSPFVKKQRLLEAISKTIQDKRNGAGGEQKLLVGRVKAVRLGRFVLNNPTVGLSLDTEGAGASEDEDGIIGGEIFRRFKVILDYYRKRMILEPNKSFNEPYSLEQSG